MAWAGDWGRGDMLEEFEDTKLKSAKRSRPAWPDASVGVDATAENGLRTSPFSLCVTKIKERMSFHFEQASTPFLQETCRSLRRLLRYIRGSEDTAEPHPPSDDVHVDQQSSQLQIFIVAVLQRD